MTDETMIYTNEQSKKFLAETEKFIGQKGFDSKEQKEVEVNGVEQRPDNDIWIALIDNKGHRTVNVRYFNDYVRGNLHPA